MSFDGFCDSRCSPQGDPKACQDGVAFEAIATCAPDDTPKLSFRSQVEYADAEHAALSFPFFNKTRANFLQSPQVESTSRPAIAPR